MEDEGDGQISTASSSSNSYETLMMRMALAEKQNREFQKDFTAKQDKINSENRDLAAKAVSLNIQTQDSIKQLAEQVTAIERKVESLQTTPNGI